MADNVIHHYTDARGLIGIITGGVLWATDVRYLNDSSEQVHALRVLRKFIDQIKPEFPKGSEEHHIVQFCRFRLENHQQRRGPVSPSHSTSAKLEQTSQRHWVSEAFPAYVVCFCEESDLVTQWNTYGARGAGFSVGLERSQLAAMIQPEPISDFSEIPPQVRLVKVQYSEADQMASLKKLFEKHLKEFRRRRQKSKSALEIGGCAGEFVHEAGLFATDFKHPCFASEAEWRIVITFTGYANRLFF